MNESKPLKGATDNLPDRVLAEVLQEIPLTGDLLEYLYLLLMREERDGYPTFPFTKQIADEHIDVYAFVLITFFRLIEMHETGLPVSIGQLLAKTEWLPKIRDLQPHPILTSQLITDLQEFKVGYRLPQSVRREHTYILGSTGSGKTQLIQQLISFDLDTNAAIIVIDSQGDLINTLKQSKRIDPERLVLIDPVDSVTHPLALNMFDVKHLDDPVEHERRLSGVVELLNFVFSAVLDSAVTPKQSLLLNFSIRLMIATPGATIETLVDLLENGIRKYEQYLSFLSPIAQQFFHSPDFDKSGHTGYASTRKELAWRLYSLLENPAISRIFKAPKNRLDIGMEMDRGKVMLISTDRSLLKRNGCAFFGRYFLSLIAQAMQDRANRPPEHRRKCYVYVDECGDYLSSSDVNIADILHKGRKYNVSLTLAHQELRQLPDDVFHAIKTNTTTKFIGSCSVGDMKVMAGEMDLKSLSQRPLTFTVYPKGHMRPFEIHIKPGLLENEEQRSDTEVAHLIAENRAKYCMTPTVAKDATVSKPVQIDEPKDTSDDPLADYT